MKKNYLFIIAAAFAALAISCNKELEGPATQEPVTPDPEEIAGEYTHFTATADETKSALGTPVTGGYKVVWNTWNDGEADVVDTVIVNGKKASEVTITGDGTGLNFKVADVTAPYCAVVAAVNKSTTTGLWGSFDAEAKSMNVLVKGPANPQKYVAGTYDPEGIIMAAYSEENTSLNFKHYSTFLQLTVDPESSDKENVQWVYIRDGEGNYLAGSWKFDFSNPDKITLVPNNMTKPIAYYCGEEGIQAGTPMIIALPAYNYDKGLIITVKDVKGHFSSYKVAPADADYSAKAGVIMTKTVKLEPKPGEINSAEDWEAFVTFTKSNKYKNDYDIYKWVGDGTVKIGQDFTFTKEQTRLTGMDGMGLQYDLDGCGHTITFDCDTQFSLFRGLRATVKNLNIAATEGHSIVGYKGGACAFADTLYPGGKIINCTNNMPIDVSVTDISLDAGAFVKYNAGGYLEGCVNNAKITANCICTTAPNAQKASIRVGGLVATMGTVSFNAGSYGYQLCGACDMEMKDCTNNGTIEVIPEVDETAHSYGYVVFAVGGVVGWLRGHASFGGQDYEFMKTLNNCDNTGAINVYGDKLTCTTGLFACSICVGGIAGTVSPLQLSGAGTGVLNTPTGANGLLSKFIGCDNSGRIYNCVTNYSTTGSSKNKVYTAGLVGALMGNSDNFALVDNCSNIGEVVSYDLCGSKSSQRPVYCCVISGLIGYCGYADIRNCTVNCKVGNGKRGVAAIGGLSAWVVRSVKVNNCKTYFEGMFARVSNYKLNRAGILNIPAKNNSADLDLVPSLEGSELKNNQVAWDILTSDDTVSGSSVDDLTQNLAKYYSVPVALLDNPFSGTDAVRGQGYTWNDAKTVFDWSGNTVWTDHPAVGTLQ